MRLVVPVLCSLAVACVSCASSTRPADNPAAYAAAARALGAHTTQEGCPADSATLTALTDAALQAHLEPVPYGPEWACVAIQDDLSRDSMGSCTPPPDAVFGAPLSFSRRVTGELFYVGLDPREYAYDLVGTPDGIEIEVRVQFLGALAAEPARVARMQEKMNRAAELWTKNAPGGAARFRFVAVTNADTLPHFQVHLDLGEPRSPFDVTWGEDWSWHLLAHEIGHMMGLDDEYRQFEKTLGHALGQEPAWRADPALRVRWFHCDARSLMCDSKGEPSLPLPYHYYVILRRRFCRVTPPTTEEPLP